MESRPARWECEPYRVADALRLARELQLAPAVATILTRRGLSDPEAARRFLAADERLPPDGLPGVTKACTLILEHVGRGSRIAVHGDYDVDGVCSTAILVRALRALGADPTWELPSRFEDGYGLSLATVERMAGSGVELLVTVDCGITAVAEVAAARAAGIDVIVTDHHRPEAQLPDCPVVHPGLGAYGSPELCAAGVALKLSEALRAQAGQDPAGADDDVDLAALATVCDLVPLRGENRRIVREGLRMLARSRRPGLRALMEVAAVNPGELSEETLGFRLGPRINAAGRMQRADAALELLLTRDDERAGEVARELDLLNRDRREAETRILFAAEAACAPQASAAAIVVAGEGWHPGVVGIVASRLVGRWRRPCVVIALEHETGRGSGRSIPAYDLHAGLAACSAHLTRFGGHRAAAGVELNVEGVTPFRAALAAHAGARLAPSSLLAVERVDAVVPGGALGLDLADELERLRPYGAGNPQPGLLVPAARVEGVAGMGEERRHARFTLVTAGGSRSRGVAFGSSPGSLGDTARSEHDLVVHLQRNHWNGAVEPRVLLRAACPSRSGRVEDVAGEEPFWARLERVLSAGTDALLDRAPQPLPARVVDRRGQGFVGVAGDLLTSGERVVLAVADVDRRRRSLGDLVAVLAPDGLAVAAWTSLAAKPALTTRFDHLVALDPPPGGASDPLLALAPLAHLAWGPHETKFALAVWAAELDLRPLLVETYRALRNLPEDVEPDALERALRGDGRYERGADSCARVVRVLGEIGLLELDAARPSCRVPRSPRAELERSATFRACRARLDSIRRALGDETPAAATRAA